eukprot:104110_1
MHHIQHKQKYEEKENEKNNKEIISKIHVNTFTIWDIEIEDEIYCACTSGYELREIISKCPARTHVWKWKLFYSTAVHGISMNTLYNNCENIGESIIIIKDSNNNIFGGFVDVEWTVSTEYRGSIDCFVFHFIDIKKDDKRKLTIYRSSGQKNYFVRNDMESITIGAGECPAIYFDHDLNFGRTTNCTTFNSPSLSLQTQFQINTLEIWAPNM